MEKGWAAEVDVAAGGFEGEWMRVVVVRVRIEEWGMRRRRQRRQIMLV